MRISGIILHTSYFEDYLSFLTEVLELELNHLTDFSMRLDLFDHRLEIRRAMGNSDHGVEIEFSLFEDEFSELADRIHFFYYRKPSSKFLITQVENEGFELLDPDGRIWKFRSFPREKKSFDPPQTHV